MDLVPSKPHAMRGRTAGWAAVATVWLALGCATGAAGPGTAIGAPSTAVLDDAAACRGALGAAIRPDAGDALDPARIRLFNWNVQKGVHADWGKDLRELGGGSDLVLMQEAHEGDGATAALAGSRHRSFAAGFADRTGPTGVLTLSRVPPEASCRLVSLEPWLRTPKAAGITAFALGAGETLVVVNLHALNFTFGTRALAEQLDRIRLALAGHDGPLVVSGDFNTWRPGRMAVVEAFAGALDLAPLTFERDERTRVFGQRLDHIFVRGLKPLRSGAVRVGSSDHNPMWVELRR